MAAFLKLPQDLLQWELSPYMTVTDRATFNEVVDQDARIYNKLDKTLMKAHHIIAMKQKFESITSRLLESLDHLTRQWLSNDEFYTLSAKALKSMEDLTKFMLTPDAKLIVQHIRGAKDNFTSGMLMLSEEETYNDLYLGEDHINDLIKRARTTYDLLMTYEYTDRILVRPRMNELDI